MQAAENALAQAHSQPRAQSLCGIVVQIPAYHSVFMAYPVSPLCIPPLGEGTGQATVGPCCMSPSADVFQTVTGISMLCAVAGGVS